MAIKKNQNQIVFISLGLLFLILASFFYLKSKNKKNKGFSSLPSPEEIIIQKNNAVRKNGKLIKPMSDEEIKKMKEEIDSVLSSGGETVELKDVLRKNVKGQAKRAFSDSKFYYKVSFSNLPLPEKGFYYESWLKKDNDLLSTGRVAVDENNNGVIYYTASVNRSDHNEVLLSLESENGGLKSGKYFLKGKFK